MVSIREHLLKGQVNKSKNLTSYLVSYCGTVQIFSLKGAVGKFGVNINSSLCSVG